MKRIAAILIVMLFALSSYTQELDCRVQINYSKLQGTSNRQIFQSLQTAVYEFMNNRIWTNHVFTQDERIECNIYMTIDERISADEFKGSIQVQSSRPVYNTSYRSQIFKHMDNDFHFQYVEFEPLEFNINSHRSNLTAILAFYAYIMIGMDYDSFGMMAGTPFFKKAEQIVTNAQNAQEGGWKAFESLKNRYWLAENLLNDTYEPLRECMYLYHRQGMDVMSDKPANGRSQIEEALQNLKKVHNKKPGSFLMQIFVDAKGEEIVNVFSEGFPDEKSRVVEVMKRVDPANSSQYDAIMKSD